MPFCGCLKNISCCRKKHDSFEVTVHEECQHAFINKGYDDVKEQKQQEEIKISEAACLWKEVLEELRSKSNAQSLDDNLGCTSSMTWVFDILKPVNLKPSLEEKDVGINSDHLLVNNADETDSSKRKEELRVLTEQYSSSDSSTMIDAIPAIGKPAPDFKGTAVMNGEFKDISLADYEGKYLVLFFYPFDFTFVCPTEIISFSERAEDFRNIDCELVACSTDSHFCHLSWVNTDRKDGGLGQMNIPLLSDKSMRISKAYGVLKEDDGIAFRGLFVIDRKQNLRQVTVNDLQVGRDVDETLRIVQAFQFTDEHGEGHL